MSQCRTLKDSSVFDRRGFIRPHINEVQVVLTPDRLVAEMGIKTGPLEDLILSSGDSANKLGQPSTSGSLV